MALGDAKQTLDSQGGSDIIQILPKDLVFMQGAEALACLRLTPKGILRWYAGCCRTPLGVTLPTGKWSFIGLLHDCLETDGISLEEAFGSIAARVNTKSAWGTPQPKEGGRGTVVAWFLSTTLRARFNGDYQRSHFFEPATGLPVVTPRVLSATELTQARQAVEAARAASAAV
jgi:hypothetical protein